MSKPTISGKKYIQLTDNILLEYSFVADRFNNTDSIDEDVLSYIDQTVDVNNLIDYNTYGKSSKNLVATNNTNYIIARNGYTGEQYFINYNNCETTTNNVRRNCILPIKKDVSQWVRIADESGGDYSTVDNKWCESVLDVFSPEDTSTIADEYIPYDIVRIYFQSGYHTEYDGFVFNIYTKDMTNKYINLLSAIHENRDVDNVKIMSEPMWFADKIYTTYIEYRIPSTAYLSSDAIGGNTASMDVNYGQGNIYSRTNPPFGSMANLLTHGNGFYANPAIGIDVHAIIGYSQKREFKIYKTRNIVSTLFPNKDTYDKLFACVRNADDGDYFKIYGYYENDPTNPIYDFNSLYEYLSRFNGTFTITHIISVTENWFDPETNKTKTKVHAPMTYIQTWENLEEMYDTISPEISYRPVLGNTANMLNQGYGATINYTLRIISNRDNTSIIKSGSCSILNPRRFGKSISVTTINNVSDIHVYNRVSNVTGLSINAVTSPIGAPSGTNNINGVNQSSQNTSVVHVNRCVTSSFIDRRNIRVSVSPVRIDNVD